MFLRLPMQCCDDFCTFQEWNSTLCRPCSSICYRERAVSIWLQHFRTDNNRCQSSEASDTDCEFGVTLTRQETTLRFTANGYVTGRSEFCTHPSLRLSLAEFIIEYDRSEFCKTTGCQCSVMIGNACVGLPVIQRERKCRPSIVPQIVRL